MGIKETVLFVKKKAFGTYLGDAMKQILKGEHDFWPKNQLRTKQLLKTLKQWQSVYNGLKQFFLRFKKIGQENCLVRFEFTLFLVESWIQDSWSETFGIKSLHLKKTQIQID